MEISCCSFDNPDDLRTPLQTLCFLFFVFAFDNYSTFSRIFPIAFRRIVKILMQEKLVSADARKPKEMEKGWGVKYSMETAWLMDLEIFGIIVVVVVVAWMLLA